MALRMLGGRGVRGWTVGVAGVRAGRSTLMFVGGARDRARAGGRGATRLRWERATTGGRAEEEEGFDTVALAIVSKRK